MGENTIVKRIQSLQTNRECKRFFIIQGLGGVGKTDLLDDLKEYLSINRKPYISLSTDIQQNPLVILDNFSKWLIELGYTGTHPEKLKRIFQVLDEYKKYSNQLLDSTRDLPLFKLPDIELDSFVEWPTILDFAHIIASALNEFCSASMIYLLLDMSISIPKVTNILEIIISNISCPLLVVVACRKIPTFISQDNIADNVQLEPMTKTSLREYVKTKYDISDIDLHKLFYITGGHRKYVDISIQYLERKKADKLIIDKKTGRIIYNIVRTSQLKEINDSLLHEIVRYAALCRTPTKGAIKNIAENKNILESYDKLSQCSFILGEVPFIYMLPLLRRSFLVDWIDKSPEYFKTSNEKLLRYYKKEKKAASDDELFFLEISEIYHLLCLNEIKGEQLAIDLLGKAEEHFDIIKINKIFEELEEYPIVNNINREWLEYWEANILRLKWKWEEAKQIFTNIINKSSSTIIRGYAYWGYGQLLRNIGNWDLADKQLQNTIQIFSASKNNNLNFFAMILRGNILSRRHKWSEALETLKTASQLINNNNDSNKFLLEITLGKVSRSQGNWTTALNRLTRSLQLSIDLNNKNYESIAHFEMGKLYRAQHSWDKAIEALTICLEIKRNLGDVLGESICLHSLGTAKLRMGDIDAAEMHFLESIKIKENLSDKYGLAKSLYSLGHIQYDKKDFNSAKKYYNKSLTLFEEVKNPQRVSRVLSRLGMTEANQGNWDLSLNYLNQSRLVRQKSGDEQGISETFLELGKLQDKSGDLREALESFRLCVRYARESSSIAREIPALVAIARIYYKMNLIPIAQESLQSARILARQVSQYKLLSDELLKWADKDFLQGYYEVAFFCYAEAIDVLLDSNTFIGVQCNKMLQEILQILRSDPFTANKLSFQIIDQWKRTLYPETRKYYLLADKNFSGDNSAINRLISICSTIIELSEGFSKQ